MYPRLIFDLPVSLNQMYRGISGGIVLSQAARNWKQYAQLTAQNQWKCGQLEGELVVYCYYFGSRLDADNGTKLLFDSLNGICWIDDSQIVEFHVYVDRKDKDNRRIEVEIHHKQGSAF